MSGESSSSRDTSFVRARPMEHPGTPEPCSAEERFSILLNNIIEADSIYL